MEYTNKLLLALLVCWISLYYLLVLQQIVWVVQILERGKKIVLEPHTIFQSDVFAGFFL